MPDSASPFLPVLIVDDVAEVRHALRTALMLAGNIDIAGEAASGLEAVRMAESLAPVLVIMDLGMPIMDGYQATKQIKLRSPACRVIALTVHDYDSARQQAFEAGVDVFIVKGAPLESLMSAIAQQKE